MDPLYVFYSIIETVTKHTWVEKSLIIPALLKFSKFLLRLTLVRWFNKAIALILTPPILVLNKFFELIDRQIGYSTTIIPKFFLYLKGGMYKKQIRLARTQIESGCYSVCDVAAILRNIEIYLFSLLIQVDPQETDNFLNLISKAINGKISKQDLDIPAVEPLLPDCITLPCVCQEGLA